MERLEKLETVLPDNAFLYYWKSDGRHYHLQKTFVALLWLNVDRPISRLSIRLFDFSLCGNPVFIKIPQGQNEADRVFMCIYCRDVVCRNRTLYSWRDTILQRMESLVVRFALRWSIPIAAAAL